MGEAERPFSFRRPFYSARLLLGVASRRKFFSSLSKSDRVIRPQVSLHSLRSIDEIGFEAGASGVDGSLNPYNKNVSPGHERERTGQTHAGRRSECYLCTMLYTNGNQKQASSSNTSPVPRPRIKYLPLSSSQPPIPPRRSSSLPYSKILRKYELTTNPSKALTTFRLSQTEGLFFHYIVYQTTTTSHDFHNNFQDPIWTLILQISTTEPCIRRLAMRYAVLSRFALITKQPTQPKADTQTQRRLSRQYQIAASLQAFFFSLSNPSIIPLMYELALLATYMHAILHLCGKDEHGTKFWLRRGYRILRSALLHFSSDPDGQGEDLPGNIRDVALAFERLNL